jgi:head-tail adaptor
MIGALRTRIEILGAAATPDDGGGASVAWAPVASVWAGVARLPSTPDFAGDRRRRLKRVKALIRARNDVALGGRIRHEGADYEIVSIEEDDARGRRIVLACEEVAP